LQLEENEFMALVKQEITTRKLEEQALEQEIHRIQTNINEFINFLQKMVS